MTKNEELEVLYKAIHELGADSYLGPWLDSVADEVRSTIESDIQPTISIDNAQQEANQIIEEAKEQASEIIKDATAKAEKVTKEAYDKWEKLSNALYDVARSTIRQLQD